MKKEIIRSIFKPVAVGFAAAVWSAFTGFFAYGAIGLFCAIPTETGYIAVLDFIAATLSTVLAISALWLCGAWVLHKGKFAR